MDTSDAAFFLKNFLGTVLLYPAGPLLLAFAGVFVSRRRPRLGWSGAMLGLSVLLIFSLPVVANAIAGVEERKFPPFDASTWRADDAAARTAIVVLGGGMQLGAIDYGGETINPTTLARLRTAARLQVATGLPILVTGGRPYQGRTTEASQMAETLVRDFHVPVRWRETRALDTADNARFSAPLLTADGYRRVLLVTDVSHMRRARGLFAKVGFDVVPVPTDYYAATPIGLSAFLPQGNAVRRSSWAIHEWAGYAWALSRGQAEAS